MDKLEWYRTINKALAGDEEAKEYVKANQADMKHHMRRNSSEKPKKAKAEKPKEKKETKKRIVEKEEE